MYFVPVMFGAFVCYCTALLVGIYHESIVLGMMAGSGVGAVVLMIGVILMVISPEDFDPARFDR